MSSKTKKQNDPSVYAVLHHTGRVWRGLVVRNGMGRDSHSPPAILASREFAMSMAGRIETWLDEHSVSEVMCVLPSSAVICRTCPLPDAPMEQLEAALRLQAEAHLLGIAPPHRLGMAVLEKSPGETARSGIILAWPESAAVDLPPTSRPVTFTPDIAAIAAMIDGHRPTQPMLWLDRASGSVAMALSHASGVSFRSLREDDDDSEAWKTSIGRALAETGLNAGHTPDFIQAVVNATRERLDGIAADECALLVPDEVVERSKARFTGAGSDATWWGQFGIAAGAVLVRTGPLTSLSQLRESAPAESPSRVRNAVQAMSTPKMAMRLAVACVLFMMFGPLAINWARMTVLELRFADIDTKLRLVNDARDSLIVYRELGDNAWPMTKILADIACNTPEGVELDSIRINPGGTFVVRGRALPHGGLTATGVVVAMQENLRETGMFADVTVSWGDSDAFGNYDFDIAARLLRPYHRFSYPEERDFGRLTLAERLYGPRVREGTTGTAAAPPDREESFGDPRDSRMAAGPAESQDSGFEAIPDGGLDRSADASAPEDPYAELYNPTADRGGFDRPSARSMSGSIGGDAGTRESVRGQSGLPASQDIPAPMTEEQIRAMSEAEVLDMLIRVGHARRAARARNDEELEQRLQREFDWLMARRRGDM